MGIILETENQNCYIEATNNPLEYVASGVNVGGQLAYKSAYRLANFGLTLIFDQPTTVTVRNPSAQTLSASKSGDYYVCAYTINWFSHSTYTSLTNVPVLDTQADFDAWVYGSDPPPVPTIISNGGGATHIAKRTGQLKDLSSYTSDILMVSGGGGGGLIIGEDVCNGANAGGISGSGSNSGNQSTGYAFGQGESGTNKSGGGGGYYGGYKSIVG